MSIQYKRVAAGFYTDTKIVSFGIQPPHPTTFLQWLLTGPAFGVLPCCASIGRLGMAEQSGWSPDQIDMMMQPLVDSGIVQFDPKAPFIYLPNALRFNGPKSPSNVIGWQSDWRKLPNCVLKERAWHMIKAHCSYRDSDVVLDKKKKPTPRNRFLLAFNSIEKPPESPIEPLSDSNDHRSDHRSSKKNNIYNNNNRNNNRNTGPASPDASNVTPLHSTGGES